MNRLEPLEPGDVVCDQCNGSGEPGNNKIDPNDNFRITPWYCDKCHGKGKIDWIENIVGKRTPKNFTINWDETLSGEAMSATKEQQQYIDNVAKKMAENIDKQIMDSLINGVWNDTTGAR